MMRGTSLKEDFNMKEKSNILKEYKIDKVMREPSDIVVNTTEWKSPVESNTYHFLEVKTDGVILHRYNGDEKESKVVGSTVTIVDRKTQRSYYRNTRDSRKVYSEKKWISKKDIERISERCREGNIDRFMSDDRIWIDGKDYLIRYIRPNIFGEVIPLDKGFDSDSVVKTDGQKFEVDGRIYVRNASYILLIGYTDGYRQPRILYHQIWVDYDKATGQTIKNIRDDFHIGYYEARKKFQ